MSRPEIRTKKLGLLSLLFLVCFDKAQEILEDSSTPQKVSIPSYFLFFGIQIWAGKIAMVSFFSLWLWQQPFFRAQYTQDSTLQAHRQPFA